MKVFKSVNDNFILIGYDVRERRIGIARVNAPIGSNHNSDNLGERP
jgi:hypothetical protein